jgi:putative sterol carrier protein
MWLLKYKPGRALVSRLVELRTRRYNNQTTLPETGSMSDINALFSQMEQQFDATAAVGVEAVFQYQLDDAGPWFVAIADGNCTITEGENASPTVTLSMDSQTLSEIMSGELDGMSAFMGGRVRADGDIMVATQLAKLFPPA